MEPLAKRAESLTDMSGSSKASSSDGLNPQAPGEKFIDTHADAHRFKARTLLAIISFNPSDPRGTTGGGGGIPGSLPFIAKVKETQGNEGALPKL